MSTEIYGIDVSEYQGAINWSSVKNSGKQFAMLRCGYGRYSDQKDTRFEEYYSGAKAAGIPVGTYLFSYATTVEQARMEAENCLTLIRGKQFEYPVAYDVETPAQARLGREALSEIVTTFCKIVEDAGYYVSVYANLNFVENYFNSSVTDRYDIWLAQWSDRPTYNGSFGMWQYSASGSVRGISTAVDLDVAYKDYPNIIKRNGLNGWGDASNGGGNNVGGETPDNDTNGNGDSDEALPAGTEITLRSVPLYSTSSASIYSTTASGTYYIYDGKLINGRYRITNKKTSVGKRPLMFYVSGWINSGAARE